MRSIAIFDGGAQPTALGLGCAAMLGRSSRRESLRALGAAWDAGITLYDTARSYGYGESERLLGEFFAGERRTRAVISTKFGILPASRNWKQRIKPLAQLAVKAVPALRGFARQQGAGQLTAGVFSVDELKASLETSLRELRTDYVDLLLMHAAPLGGLDNCELLETMERLVKSGKVRMAGISGESEVISAAFARMPTGLRTAQFAMNVGDLKLAPETEQAARQGWFLVANHPFGGAGGVAEFGRRIDALHRNTALDAGLREKLRPDAALMPELVLNLILNGTGVHSAIPAMMDPRHLAANVQAVEQCRFSEQELAMLRGLFLQPERSRPR